MKSKLYFFIILASIFTVGCSTIAGFFKSDGSTLAVKIAVSEIIYQADDQCAVANKFSIATQEARKIVNDGFISITIIDSEIEKLIFKQDISPTSKIILLEVAKNATEEHSKLVESGQASDEDKATLNKVLDDMDLIVDSYLGDC